MSANFALTGKQWATGLALCCVAAPILASVPLSVAMILDENSALSGSRVAGGLLLGAISAMWLAGLPGLVLGAVAITLAQRTIRARGLPRARSRVLAIGAALGAATGGVPSALLHEAGPALALVLMSLGALSGLCVAAHCLQLLRRQLAA